MGLLSQEALRTVVGTWLTYERLLSTVCFETDNGHCGVVCFWSGELGVSLGSECPFFCPPNDVAALEAAAKSLILLAAGAGFEPATFRL